MTVVNPAPGGGTSNVAFFTVIGETKHMSFTLKNPTGKVEFGFTVADMEAFYRDISAKGVLFSIPPRKQDFGGLLAQFVDSESAHCSVAAKAA